MKVYYAYTIKCGHKKTEVYADLERAKQGLEHMILSVKSTENHSWIELEPGDWVFGPPCSFDPKVTEPIGGVEEYTVIGDITNNTVCYVLKSGIDTETNIFGDPKLAEDWLKGDPDSEEPMFAESEIYKIM